MQTIYHVKGATCSSCMNHVVKVLSSYKDITIIRTDLKRLTIEIKHSDKGLDDINGLLSKEGYELVEKKKQSIGIQIAFALGLIAFLAVSNKLYGRFGVSQMSSQLNLIAIFTYGLLTSFHCVSMCGGIALSRNKSEFPVVNLKHSLAYNSGRILTYALIGGLLGLFGNMISITQEIRSVLFIGIALVMILIGLNNLGLIQRINLTRRFKFKGKLPKSSFLVGVMNGFMPCGPLQTMQIIALSTMSFYKGFLFMLIFGLGTSVMLLIMGNLFLVVPMKHRQSILKTSGIVVIVMALMILNQGMTGLGVDTTLNSIETVSSNQTIDYAPIVDGHQVVHMDVNGFYDIENLMVKKDIPVKLVFNTTRLTPCIDTITIPRYDITKALTIGTDEIIFTPTESEDMVITCWMNMVSTSLTVE